MCAVPVYNPYIPQIPGAAGLYFALNDDKYWPHERELVVVRHDGPDAVWNVMGNYEIKKSTPLSPQEFNMLPQEVSPSHNRHLLVVECLLSYSYTGTKRMAKKRKRDELGQADLCLYFPSFA